MLLLTATVADGNVYITYYRLAFHIARFYRVIFREFAFDSSNNNCPSLDVGMEWLLLLQHFKVARMHFYKSKMKLLVVARPKFPFMFIIAARYNSELRDHAIELSDLQNCIN